MPTSSGLPSRKEVFEGSFAGAIGRPLLPPLRHDNQRSRNLIPHSLEDYRALETSQQREARIRSLWSQLPHLHTKTILAEKVDLGIPVFECPNLSPQDAEELRKLYVQELLGLCENSSGASSSHRVDWGTFREYVDSKEEELWEIFHHELDLDGNGHLDSTELQHALSKAGMTVSPKMLTSFMAFLSASPHSHAVSFPEFRDFFLLLPRKASPEEIFRYYQVRRYLGEDGRGVARVNMEGDVTLIAHDRPYEQSSTEESPGSDIPTVTVHRVDFVVENDSDQEASNSGDSQTSIGQSNPPSERQAWFGGTTAGKFLLAGGIAGAVSRTATAPFDRLKVFLITQPPDLISPVNGDKHAVRGLRALLTSMGRLYMEGGILAFWVGNGLNVVKIFPVRLLDLFNNLSFDAFPKESAIKFFAYESSKRFFATYWDHVDDSRNISGSSRFLSGGIGGITSQLAIYPIETLKTQMMSSTGEQKRTILEASRRLWALGGMHAYYRGLVGLVGVFPYSAIDMSTFEALKLAYVRSVGEKDPGVLATLAFGSISGSVGATSVYPLNLIRTRLQAAGSSGHPQRYSGVLDVTVKTYEKEGVRGFYRGLVPTLAKVIPAVSISYVVYEQCKNRLGLT